MRIDRHDLAEACVLAVRGDLDLAYAPKLAVVAGETLRERKRLVLDLRGVEFVDSCGLAVLMNIKRRAVRLQASLAMACDVPATLRLLETTRLDRVLDVYPTVEAAIDRLADPGPVQRSA